ncbi:MAG: hypothetical protein AAF328_03505, partial [Planctomycetota bacterium]
AERVFENPRWAVRGAEAEAQRDARVMGLGQGAPAGFGGASFARVLWQVKQEVVYEKAHGGHPWASW